MYAIANVIYGIPLEIEFKYYYSDVKNDENHVRVLENHFKNQTPGFLQYYSGGGPTPLAFGVEIDRFDECYNVKVSELNLIPSEEVKQKYQEMFEELDIDTQQELKTFGEPEVIFLWSTS